MGVIHTWDEWRDLFRAEVKASGRTVKDIALDVGVTEDRLHHYKSGRSRPSHTTVVRIAEVLVCQRLVRLSQGLWSDRCRICGREMVMYRASQLYCGQRCRNRMTSERRRASYDKPIEKLTRDLHQRDDAISRMCHSCELDGVCRTPSCALRPVSPFLLAPFL